MPPEMMLISRYPTKPGKARGLAAAMTPDPDRGVLVAMDGDEVVTLEPVADETSLVALRDGVRGLADGFAPWLAGDVRRELLDFVEAPKPCAAGLPRTSYVQLRHVEVKPERMADYREWREKTIFDVVRSADEVEAFLAYHSVVSGQPGVMFVSGFSVDPAEYEAVFASDRYATIVREAGDRFITGGAEGLYTKIYRVCAPLAA